MGNKNSFRDGRKVTNKHFGLAEKIRFLFQGISVHHNSCLRVTRIQWKSDPREIKTVHVPLFMLGPNKFSY